MRHLTRALIRRGLLGAAAAVLFLVAASPAFALTNPDVTINQQVGGESTRFTFTATTDKDAPVSALTLRFPEGFDIRKAYANVVTLQGLKRTTVKASTSVRGQDFQLAFDPAIGPGSELRVMVYSVMTPNVGGTYALGVKYESGGQQRSAEGADLTFSYVTASRSVKLSRYLDQQPWVAKWNSVTALNLFLKPQLIVTSAPLMFTGWLMSLALVGVGFPLAIIGGLMLAFMKMSKIPPLRWIAAAYVNVIRGTPLFLQIFVAFIGLPIAGVHAPWFVTGFVVLALNSSAYLAEIFRAGIQSIHKGQLEAALSLGMTYPQAMQHVIVPQTVKRVLPTMTSEFILLFKDTALLSAVGVFELMMYGSNIVARSGNLTPFVVAAVYYLLVTTPLINWVGKLEARLALAEHGQGAPEPKRRSLWDLLATRRALTRPAIEAEE